MTEMPLAGLDPSLLKFYAFRPYPLNDASSSDRFLSSNLYRNVTLDEWRFHPLSCPKDQQPYSYKRIQSRASQSLKSHHTHHHISLIAHTRYQ
jgi:hypothetical protein